MFEIVLITYVIRMYCVNHANGLYTVYDIIIL